jgi:hypothetical protein
MKEQCIKVRKKIVEICRREMLGPGSEDIGVDIEHEVISDSPVERYSLGVLFPQNNKFNIDDNEKDVEVSENEETQAERELIIGSKSQGNSQNKSIEENPNDEEAQEQISMANQTLPSAMGLTFFAKGVIEKLNVIISCAQYRVSKFTDCAVRLEESFDFNRYGLSEYFYAEDGLVKLKSNISGNVVFDLVSKNEAIKVERPDIVAILYKLCDLCSSEKNRHYGYVRVPFLVDKNVQVPLTDEFNKIYIGENGNLSNDEGIIKITVLKKKYDDDIFSYTVVMVNDIKAKKNYKTCIYQPEIRINTNNNKIKLLEHTYMHHKGIDSIDKEDVVFDLMYRNKKTFAIGHGVATGQKVDMKIGEGEIFTDFFPSFEVPQLDFNIHELGEGGQDLLSMYVMSDLSSASKSEKVQLLNRFSEAYNEWINELSRNVVEIEEGYKSVAEKQISECRVTLSKIRKGISLLARDQSIYDAFILMNRAMLMQRAHSKLSSSDYDRFPFDEDKEMPKFDYHKINKKDASWRAFQLAFILMNIESISNPESEERDIVDLIWIPTGGGKTEAYLGLTAFTIFLRRLKDQVNGGGTTIIMRYTLRLLAAQQFIRASILICACEKIRRESKDYNLGNEEISIGLWVGGTPTPNTNEDAKTEFKKLTASTKSEGELNNLKLQHNKFQVLKCPWCGTKLEVEYVDGKKKGAWGYDYNKKKIIYCPEFECDFSTKLPIQVVDEEMYKNPPTLLFGTVDKFAALPWKGEVSNLFALNKGNNNKQPELIIQDELHLISGPLGSMVGLYETAIDAMCSAKGVKPKIIASTATIKRAKEQCKMLFNRSVSQFPPSGLNIEDCFFTKEIPVEKEPGRLYVGLMPSGKTSTTTQIRLYTALIESLRFIDAPDEVLDKYWTLIGYFNSIKELGKTSTLVKDDIASNNIRYMKRLLKFNEMRYAVMPRELTSRLESTEIIKTLKDLENTYAKRMNESENKTEDNYNKAINILLASNMISVGVDVSRLGLMVVSGQPKQTAEYIQATSRVGRRYPGLAFTLYNASKTRDRSHYEMFHSYHQTFYRYVEPTSITPFSEQARERGLHAIFISMVRHMLGLCNDEQAKEFSENLNNIDRVKKFILDRVKELDDSESKAMYNETSKELEQVIYRWDNKVKTSGSNERVHYYSKNADKNLLVPFLEEDDRNAFPTMQSMRNVDDTAKVEIVEFGGEIDE